MAWARALGRPTRRIGAFKCKQRVGLPSEGIENPAPGPWALEPSARAAVVWDDIRTSRRARNRSAFKGPRFYRPCCLRYYRTCPFSANTGDGPWVSRGHPWASMGVHGRPCVSHGVPMDLPWASRGHPRASMSLSWASMDLQWAPMNFSRAFVGLPQVSRGRQLASMGPVSFYGRPMGHPWVSHALMGTHVRLVDDHRSPWETHGRPMGDPWETHGRPMEDPWETHGRPMEDPWETHGCPWTPTRD